MVYLELDMRIFHLSVSGNLHLRSNSYDFCCWWGCNIFYCCTWPHRSENLDCNDCMGKHLTRVVFFPLSKPGSVVSLRFLNCHSSLRCKSHLQPYYCSISMSISIILQKSLKRNWGSSLVGGQFPGKNDLLTTPIQPTTNEYGRHIFGAKWDWVHFHH